MLKNVLLANSGAVGIVVTCRRRSHRRHAAFDDHDENQDLPAR